MKILKRQIFGLLILLYGQLPLQGMFTQASRIKRAQQQLAQRQQRLTNIKQKKSANISSQITISPFSREGQKRSYVSSWANWIKSKIMGTDNRDELKDQLFLAVNRLKNRIESGEYNLKSISIENIVQNIQNEYKDVVTWTQDGVSINHDFFEIVKFTVIQAIKKSQVSGHFDSSDIRIALKLCHEIGKMAPEKYSREKIIIQEIVTLLFNYLINRYQGNEELILIDDLIEIYFLIQTLEQPIFLQTYMSKKQLNFFKKLINELQTNTIIDFAYEMSKRPSLLDIILIREKFDLPDQVAYSMIKKLVNNMFSSIRQQLNNNKDQSIITRLQKIISFNQDELDEIHQRLLYNSRKKRIFYFEEDEPYQYQQEQENENRREEKQQRGGSFSYDIESDIEDLKKHFNLSYAPDEIVLKAVNQYIMNNHPDKFPAGPIRDKKTKEFQLFMGQYDKAIEKLKNQVKKVKQQQQQHQRNRE